MNRERKKIVNNVIVSMHDSGTSRNEIAESVGLTTERVRQILQKHGRDTSNSKNRNYERVMHEFIAVLGDTLKENQALGDINREYFFQWMRHKKGIIVHEIYRKKHYLYYKSKEDCKLIVSSYSPAPSWSLEKCFVEMCRSYYYE